VACCGRLGASMRRRDYELVARQLKTVRPNLFGERGKDEYTGWRTAVESIGRGLEQDNAGFDYPLWLHNCGVEWT